MILNPNKRQILRGYKWLRCAFAPIAISRPFPPRNKYTRHILPRGRSRTSLAKTPLSITFSQEAFAILRRAKNKRFCSSIFRPLRVCVFLYRQKYENPRALFPFFFRPFPFAFKIFKRHGSGLLNLVIGDLPKRNLIFFK